MIKYNNRVLEKLILKIAGNQLLFLCVAIAAMFASQGQILLEQPELFVKILTPILIFLAINFCLGQIIGRLAHFSYAEVVCFNCTTLARNSPIALAIATSAFPERPLIALVLVIGALIELPVLICVSQLLLFWRSLTR